MKRGNPGIVRLAAALSAILVLSAAAGAPRAAAQCLLANPSFEVVGSGTVFGGWNQFGSVGSSPNAVHGSKAARLTGPNAGGWDVSGYWQQLASVPGDRWIASVDGWHTAVRPLTGQSAAILNIEWRNSSGVLISYESHTVAGAATPTGQVQEFTVTSGPAPSGTVAVRLMLGVLQAPGTSVPDVYFDTAEFHKTSPSLAAIQWNDFPGGRTLSFGGRTWRVKGPGYYGPGPNLFSDGSGSVWVDPQGRLHVTVKNIGGSWYSTEVALVDALGYGDYIFTTEGRLDLIDPQVVLGLFLWQYGHCWDPAWLWWNPFNEIDVEFSRWGNPANSIGQFVAQPFDGPANISRFAATFGNGEITSHAFRWLPDKVEYRSWRGGPGDESPGSLIHSWTYAGAHIPRPEQPRVHINLWRITGAPASNQEVILSGFNFIPHGSVVAVPEEPPAAGRIPALLPPSPNPFSAGTTLRWRMREAGHAEVTVHDLAGRRIRVLADGPYDRGEHEAVWNGRDDAGRRLASGIYMLRFRSGPAVETRRIVLLK